MSRSRVVTKAEIEDENRRLRARVAALEAAMRAHDDCRVCRELLGLVPSTGQETT